MDTFMNKIILVLGFFTLLTSNISYGCSPPPLSLKPSPAFMMLSENKQAMLKIVPERLASDKQGMVFTARLSRMESYQLNTDGQLRIIWSAKNIYQNSLGGSFFISDDGIYLIEIKEIGDINDKRALTIYKNGKIFKNYSAKDFMPTLTVDKIQISSCGTGSWIIDMTSVRLYENFLIFQTIDGKEWSFDIVSGSI
jgi:hypothetical protein